MVYVTLHDSYVFPLKYKILMLIFGVFTKKFRYIRKKGSISVDLLVLQDSYIGRFSHQEL